MNRNKMLKSRRGIALILTLGVIFMLGVIAGSFAFFSSMSRSNTKQYVYSSEAYSAANAGYNLMVGAIREFMTIVTEESVKVKAGETSLDSYRDGDLELSRRLTNDEFNQLRSCLTKFLNGESVNFNNVGVIQNLDGEGTVLGDRLNDLIFGEENSWAAKYGFMTLVKNAEDNYVASDEVYHIDLDGINNYKTPELNRQYAEMLFSDPESEGYQRPEDFAYDNRDNEKKDANWHIIRDERNDVIGRFAVMAKDQSSLVNIQQADIQDQAAGDIASEGDVSRNLVLENIAMESSDLDYLKQLLDKDLPSFTSTSTDASQHLNLNTSDHRTVYNYLSGSGNINNETKRSNAKVAANLVDYTDSDHVPTLITQSNIELDGSAALPANSDCMGVEGVKISEVMIQPEQVFKFENFKVDLQRSSDISSDYYYELNANPSPGSASVYEADRDGSALGAYSSDFASDDEGVKVKAPITIRNPGGACQVWLKMRIKASNPLEDDEIAEMRDNAVRAIKGIEGRVTYDASANEYSTGTSYEGSPVASEFPLYISVQWRNPSNGIGTTEAIEKNSIVKKISHRLYEYIENYKPSLKDDFTKHTADSGDFMNDLELDAEAVELYPYPNKADYEIFEQYRVAPFWKRDIVGWNWFIIPIPIYGDWYEVFNYDYRSYDPKKYDEERYANDVAAVDSNRAAFKERYRQVQKRTENHYTPNDPNMTLFKFRTGYVDYDKDSIAGLYDKSSEFVITSDASSNVHTVDIGAGQMNIDVNDEENEVYIADPKVTLKWGNQTKGVVSIDEMVARITPKSEADEIVYPFATKVLEVGLFDDLGDREELIGMFYCVNTNGFAEDNGKVNAAEDDYIWFYSVGVPPWLSYNPADPESADPDFPSWLKVKMNSPEGEEDAGTVGASPADNLYLSNLCVFPRENVNLKMRFRMVNMADARFNGGGAPNYRVGIDGIEIEGIDGTLDENSSLGALMGDLAIVGRPGWSAGDEVSVELKEMVVTQQLYSTSLQEKALADFRVTDSKMANVPAKVPLTYNKFDADNVYITKEELPAKASGYDYSLQDLIYYRNQRLENRAANELHASEYVEIFNGTSKPLDMDGWVVKVEQYKKETDGSYTLLGPAESNKKVNISGSVFNETKDIYESSLYTEQSLPEDGDYFMIFDTVIPANDSTNLSMPYGVISNGINLASHNVLEDTYNLLFTGDFNSFLFYDSTSLAIGDEMLPLGSKIIEKGNVYLKDGDSYPDSGNEIIVRDESLTSHSINLNADGFDAGGGLMVRDKPFAANTPDEPIPWYAWEDVGGVSSIVSTTNHEYQTYNVISGELTGTESHSFTHEGETWYYSRCKLFELTDEAKNYSYHGNNDLWLRCANNSTVAAGLFNNMEFKNVIDNLNIDVFSTATTDMGQYGYLFSTQSKLLDYIKDEWDAADNNARDALKTHFVRGILFPSFSSDDESAEADKATLKETLTENYNTADANVDTDEDSLKELLNTVSGNFESFIQNLNGWKAKVAADEAAASEEEEEEEGEGKGKGNGNEGEEKSWWDFIWNDFDWDWSTVEEQWEDYLSGDDGVSDVEYDSELYTNLSDSLTALDGKINSIKSYVTDTALPNSDTDADNDGNSDLADSNYSAIVDDINTAYSNISDFLTSSAGFTDNNNEDDKGAMQVCNSISVSTDADSETIQSYIDDAMVIATRVESLLSVIGEVSEDNRSGILGNLKTIEEKIALLPGMNDWVKGGVWKYQYMPEADKVALFSALYQYIDDSKLILRKNISDFNSAPNKTFDGSTESVSLYPDAPVDLPLIVRTLDGRGDFTNYVAAAFNDAVRPSHTEYGRELNYFPTSDTYFNDGAQKAWAMVPVLFNAGRVIEIETSEDLTSCRPFNVNLRTAWSFNPAYSPLIKTVNIGKNIADFPAVWTSKNSILKLKLDGDDFRNNLVGVNPLHFRDDADRIIITLFEPLDIEYRFQPENIFGDADDEEVYRIGETIMLTIGEGEDATVLSDDSQFKIFSDDPSTYSEDVDERTGLDLVRDYEPLCLKRKFARYGVADRAVLDRNLALERNEETLSRDWWGGKAMRLDSFFTDPLVLRRKDLTTTMSAPGGGSKPAWEIAADYWVPHEPVYKGGLGPLPEKWAIKAYGSPGMPNFLSYEVKDPFEEFSEIDESALIEVPTNPDGLTREEYLDLNAGETDKRIMNYSHMGFGENNHHFISYSLNKYFVKDSPLGSIAELCDIPAPSIEEQQLTVDTRNPLVPNSLINAFVDGLEKKDGLGDFNVLSADQKKKIFSGTSTDKYEIVPYTLSDFKFFPQLVDETHNPLGQDAKANPMVFRQSSELTFEAKNWGLEYTFNCSGTSKKHFFPGKYKIFIEGLNYTDDQDNLFDLFSTILLLPDKELIGEEEDEIPDMMLLQRAGAAVLGGAFGAFGEDEAFNTERKIKNMEVDVGDGSTEPLNHEHLLQLTSLSGSEYFNIQNGLKVIMFCDPQSSALATEYNNTFESMTTTEKTGGKFSFTKTIPPDELEVAKQVILNLSRSNGFRKIKIHLVPDVRSGKVNINSAPPQTLLRLPGFRILLPQSTEDAEGNELQMAATSQVFNDVMTYLNETDINGQMRTFSDAGDFLVSTVGEGDDQHRIFPPNADEVRDSDLNITIPEEMQGTSEQILKEMFAREKLKLYRTVLPYIQFQSSSFEIVAVGQSVKTLDSGEKDFKVHATQKISAKLNILDLIDSLRDNWVKPADAFNDI